MQRVPKTGKSHRNLVILAGIQCLILTLPAAARAETRESNAEPTSEISQQKNGHSKKAKSKGAALPPKQHREDRGLSEDEESALPVKSKFRMGNEELEVDPD